MTDGTIIATLPSSQATDDTSDVELLEFEDAIPELTDVNTKKIGFNFDDVELLEIDDESDGESVKLIEQSSFEQQPEVASPTISTPSVSVPTAGFCPIPIIIKTDNFPYLLAPTSADQHKKLPFEYEQIVTLLEEAPMPGSTLHEVFSSIKETFQSLGNPFDEKDELLITFEEFALTLPDTCIHAHEVLLSEVYEAFDALVKFKGKDAPKCLSLQLKSQRAFVTRLEELRTLNGAQGEDSDAASNTILMQENADESDTASEETKIREAPESITRRLTEDDIRELNDSLESGDDDQRLLFVQQSQSSEGEPEPEDSKSSGPDQDFPAAAVSAPGVASESVETVKPHSETSRNTSESNAAVPADVGRDEVAKNTKFAEEFPSGAYIQLDEQLEPRAQVVTESTTSEADEAKIESEMVNDEILLGVSDTEASAKRKLDDEEERVPDTKRAKEEQ